MNILTKFRIPTLLGLSIITAGIAAGVYVGLQNQTIFTAKATPDSTPKNIIISNIEDTTASISWQTDAAVNGFINFGQKSANEETSLDDRDSNVPQPRQTHHVTLKNLVPSTTYQYKIVSGKSQSSPNKDLDKFTTAPAQLSENGFKPVIGTILVNNKGISDGIVYLTISGATIESGVVKNFGNFIIPIAKMRKIDLQSIFTPSRETLAKISVVSPLGSATLVFNLNDDGKPLPSLKIGQNLDLTTQISSPAASMQETDLLKYDLNGDKKINTSDYGIVLKNLGKNPKDRRADLNSDGVVDQKDLDLMSQKIKEQDGK